MSFIPCRVRLTREILRKLPIFFRNEKKIYGDIVNVRTYIFHALIELTDESFTRKKTVESPRAEFPWETTL